MCRSIAGLGVGARGLGRPSIELLGGNLDELDEWDELGGGVRKGKMAKTSQRNEKRAHGF